MVLATDKNRVLGSENRIPWRIVSDLVRLKNLTLGHPVILGRKTYDSMLGYYEKSGRQMPGRIYIVVTRNSKYQVNRDNARVATSIPEAIKFAKSYKDDQIFVNGGAEIYNAMLPHADRIYLTEVHTETSGDAFFPQLPASEWKEVSREHHFKNDKDEFDYDLIVLERK